VVFKRPPLEERIAARQRERGPLKQGKYFEGPGAIVFFAVIGAVVLTHIIAFIIIECAPH
jgi:hypothetical protein